MKQDMKNINICQCNLRHTTNYPHSVFVYMFEKLEEVVKPIQLITHFRDLPFINTLKPLRSNSLWFSADSTIATLKTYQLLKRDGYLTLDP